MSSLNVLPEWSEAPSRVNQDAYFPVSIAATVREATFSETLSGILGANPDKSVDEFEEQFRSSSLLQEADVADDIWGAFRLAYSTTSKEGQRVSDKAANLYLNPFHRRIAETIQIDEPRGWYRLYWLLMTNSDGEIYGTVHRKLVKALFNIEHSNLLERLAIDTLDDLMEKEPPTEPDDVLTDEHYQPIYPLVEECGDAFREEIEAWLKVKEKESSSRWMHGLRDIINYHYMMYILQVVINLQKEYKNVQAGEPYDYTFELHPVFFGLKTETASSSREFVKEWDEDGISRAMYDSWGRLAVMSKLVDLGLDPSTPVENKPYTLTAALNEFPEELQEAAVNQLVEHFPPEQRPAERPSLAEAAGGFSNATRRYYENQGKTERSQTAFSAGENSWYYLGRGVREERHFIESRRRVGKILRLDRASLALMARIFAEGQERTNIDNFWKYLERRGMMFDQRSKTTAVNQLEGMGLLQRQSDSGEAMYVQPI